MTLEDRIAALEAKASAIRSKVPIRFIDDTMPEQAAFIRDPARLKLAFCTRRAGKSFGEGRYLVQEASSQPNVSCLYIALTRDSAENIMWRDVLKRLDVELGLGASFNETKLRMTLPNGSTIRLLGLDVDEDEKNKLLGGKYKLVVIDEAASFTIDLNALVYETLKPAVADLRGTICMSSTPTNIHAGMFFDMTKDQDPMRPGRWNFEDWSCHRWGYEQNPYVREQVEADIAELIAKKPRIELTAGFRQHWRGNWAIDTTKLVYKFDAAVNTFSGQLPKVRRGEWHNVLGIDTGHKATAFTLVAYQDHLPELYIIESWKRRGMDITAMAAVEKSYRARFPIDIVVVDGANRQAVEEMNNRHGCQLVAADKKDKFEFIDIMNDDLIQRRIYVSTAEWEPERIAEFTDLGRCGAPEYVNKQKCGLLMDEWRQLVVDERKLLRTRKREEHPNCENHCADSALYPWRQTYPYLSTLLKTEAPRNSPEWYAEQNRIQQVKLEEQLEQELSDNRQEQRESESDDAWL